MIITMLTGSNKFCSSDDPHVLLQDTIHRFDSWLGNDVLPYWARNGFMPNGSAIEGFLANGQADLSANKRIRVQARQMFCCAYASKQGWLDDAMFRVSQLDSFVQRRAEINQSGMFCHILDHEDKIINENVDLYDCAFFLLAYAWRYAVFNDLHALYRANQLIDSIEVKLKGSSAGWLEGSYSYQCRRQNPHMHLFEAFLALYQATQDAKWLGYAGEIFGLFENVFYDHKHGVVREFFSHNWQLSTTKGDIIEPGHMMEWVWLLQEYHKYTNKPVAQYCHALYRNALSLGLTKADPPAHSEKHSDDNCWRSVLLDQVDLKTGESSQTKRCWPMTEWIKASLAMARTVPTPNPYLDDARIAIENLLHHFINPQQPSLYVDQLDANNQVINASAPASTLYHLFMAHAEARQFL
ncbi:mannose-6-phosphate isomerase [Paraglaciecola chathamensis]|uniref:Mannose-6-phosphate isomerase n=2 Tax=Paraglaciecola chathamensis TaxID=368405 RepID=A0A8H9M0P3_9ALTE|nr:mannose-6-phosphate isomerase [Paraglaciecola oceanifecundans]